MTEQEQIEEMAKEIEKAKQHIWASVMAQAEDEDYLWHSRAIAEHLTSQGYRKVDDENYVGREWHDEQVLILAGEIDELKEQLAEYQPIKNLNQENQRLHTELKKYKKALELIGKQYMSDMGMGKSIEDDTEYYEINLRDIIQTAIKQAEQEVEE